MEYLNEHKLVLASGSPRRKILLGDAGIDMTIHPSKIDESTFVQTTPEEYAKQLSLAKARDVAKLYPESWILGADTIVVIDNEILEKPNSKDDAVLMLNKLKNKRHQVYTGYSLCNLKKEQNIIQSVKTDVYFNDLSEKEISWYVNTGEPFDKAGGYGIQGKGAFLVKKIEGSYTNVVGLPVGEILNLLSKHKIIRY